MGTSSNDCRLHIQLGFGSASKPPDVLTMCHYSASTLAWSLRLSLALGLRLDPDTCGRL